MPQRNGSEASLHNLRHPGLMKKRKVLYVSHNHPIVRPGGAETYALELYEAMKSSETFEPYFLAKTGPPISNVSRPHEGTLLSRVNADPNQYFFHTDGGDYDWFYGTPRGKDVHVKFFNEFLSAIRPDVVHFQHTLFLGYDVLQQTRRSLPGVPIIYTLHEYLPICHRNGQMVRTMDEERCMESSPRRCHECFPNFSQQQFFMRKKFVESHFSLVDLFLAPSHFLRERYLDWGIAPERIEFEDYGRTPIVSRPAKEVPRPHNRLGFFGQLSHFKGVNVLLKAMQILIQENSKNRSQSHRNLEVDAQLWVHGANLELQPGTFQNEFRSLLEATKQNVTFAGRYAPQDMGALMENVDWVVIPSIWWENAPLVIQEAFMHGKPVICSNIGGMAEKVTHMKNGLHFHADDPLQLAQTIRQAVTTTGLWEELKTGIPDTYLIADSVTKLTGIYDRLIEAKDRAHA